MDQNKQFMHETIFLVGVVFAVAFIVVLMMFAKAPTTQNFGRVAQPIVEKMPITQCNDGIDNDDDKTTDLEDKDCLALTDVSEESSDDCVDSDNGFMLHVQGNTYGIANGELFNFRDVCINSDILKEFVCTGNSYSSADISCNGFKYSRCLEGKCV